MSHMCLFHFCVKFCVVESCTWSNVTHVCPNVTHVCHVLFCLSNLCRHIWHMVSCHTCVSKCHTCVSKIVHIVLCHTCVSMCHTCVSFPLFVKFVLSNRAHGLMSHMCVYMSHMCVVFKFGCQLCGTWSYAIHECPNVTHLCPNVAHVCL